MEMNVLRLEPGEVRTLLRFAPGKGYPRHKHPAGEEVFVISGVYSDNGVDYPEGSYIYYPSNSDHAPISETGCTILVISPEVPVHI
ncbi:cupin domain-containing protein [Paenibacillus mesophilus]|uniref:cupin domain-containing protein n=1 Tax=Paenibacillus mesophilus TaxID=2582849 RepID=UPI00130537D0